MENEIYLLSTITCSECGYQKEETMPTDACQFFYECEKSHEVLKPLEGDCCVYCSYGTKSVLQFKSIMDVVVRFECRMLEERLEHRKIKPTTMRRLVLKRLVESGAAISLRPGSKD